MPQFLALTVHETLVRGILADVASGRVDVRKAFEVQSPSSLLTGDSLQNQAWLRETLQQQGITADQTLIAVTRDSAIVRRLELPTVPVTELPTYVGFQARTKLAQPFDTLMWDFLPAPQASSGIAVLLAALPKVQLNTLVTTLTGAGLKPAQISVTSAIIAEYATHGQTALRSVQSLPLTVIHLDGDRLEITLLQQGVLTATHGYQMSHEDPAVPQILTEITRASMAFQKLLPSGSTSQLCLSAPEPIATELSNAITARFQQTPQSLTVPTAIKLPDSLTDSAHVPYVELLGQLLTQAGGSLPSINLLAPRRTQPKRDYSRRRMVILAAGVIAILATGGGLYAMQWSDVAGKVRQLEKEDQGLTNYLKRAEPILKSGQAVETWQHMKVDWLDELKQFSPVLPPGDKLFLTGIQLKGIASPHPLHRGMVTLTGAAKQRDDVIKLEMAAVNVPDKYQVLPHTVKTRNANQNNNGGQPQGGNQNNGYPIEFDLTFNLNVPKKNAKPTAPAANKPATPTPPAGTPPTENKPTAGDNKTPPAATATPTITPPAAPTEPPKSPPATTPAAPAQPATPPAAPPATPPATANPPAATATPQSSPAAAPATAAPATSSPTGDK